MPDNAHDPNAAAGQRIQDKYEFYSLALSFTALAAATQTARFGTMLAADVLELAAWIALLSSGIAAMVRLERKPFVYRLFSMQNRYEGLRDVAQKAVMQGATTLSVLESGSVESASDYLANAKKSVATVKAKRKDETRSLGRLYMTHRFALYGGLTALVIARALPAVQSIVTRLSK